MELTLKPPPNQLFKRAHWYMFVRRSDNSYLGGLTHIHITSGSSLLLFLLFLVPLPISTESVSLFLTCLFYFALYVVYILNFLY